MDGRGSLSEDPAFKKLADYFKANGDKVNISDLFAADPDRFSKFRYTIMMTLVKVTALRAAVGLAVTLSATLSAVFGTNGLTLGVFSASL